MASIELLKGDVVEVKSGVWTGCTGIIMQLVARHPYDSTRHFYSVEIDRATTNLMAYELRFLYSAMIESEPQPDMTLPEWLR